MAEEGRVYTTCDDDHFLLTEDEAYEEFAQGRFVVDALNETDEAQGSTLEEDTQHNKTWEVNTAHTHQGSGLRRLLRNTTHPIFFYCTILWRI